MFARLYVSVHIQYTYTFVCSAHEITFVVSLEQGTLLSFFIHVRHVLYPIILLFWCVPYVKNQLVSIQVSLFQNWSSEMLLTITKCYACYGTGP